TAEERRDYCTKYLKWRISHLFRLVGVEAKLRREMLDEMRIDGLLARVEIMLLEGRAHGYFDDWLREARDRSRGFDPLLRSSYFDASMSPPSSAEFAAALLANPKTRSYELGDRAEQFGCDVLGPVYIHLVQRTVATRLMKAAKHLSVFS